MCAVVTCGRVRDDGENVDLSSELLCGVASGPPLLQLTRVEMSLCRKREAINSGRKARKGRRHPAPLAGSERDAPRTTGALPAPQVGQRSDLSISHRRHAYWMRSLFLPWMEIGR